MHIHERYFQTTRDGLTIRGIEYRPEGENLPIAIVSHGFLQNYKSTRHYAKQFAQWGYAAYCYDFIGGGIDCHSDGKLQDMSVLTEMQDLCAVMDYTSKLSYTNGNSLTLIGCSQGGFVSAMVAAELGDAVSNLILFYPALCIPNDARKGKMMVFRFAPANIPDQLRFGPLTLSGDYARAVIHMDPYEKICGYHGPVLILHGTKDSIVNLSYSQKAKDTYGESCTLQILDKAGHGFTKKEDRQAFTAIREFLKLDGAFSPHIFHKEVRPGIFRLSETASGYSDEPGAATRNSYLVVGKEKAVLFDLALEKEGLLAHAQKLAGMPVQVVFSHGHVDHVYHANKIKDAWLHPADFRLLQKGMLILPPVRPCPNLHPLEDGDILNLGERTLEVIHCPGHTDGGILLLDRQTQTLLTGDVISRRLLFNFPGTTDLGSFCKQLETLKEKDFTVIYTAHDRCGLPKEHLELMLDTIQNQLSNATKTWLSPFGQKMRQCTVGKEDDLQYFDICIERGGGN